MTDQTIHPCPVCGAKPKWNADRTQLVGNPECNGCDGDNQGFRRKANALLASALRTHGIHTLAELESRLAPDPQVAVLEYAGIKTADELRSILGDENWRELLDKIAAQRGEG